MIYLNARFTGQGMTGVQRVAYELGRRVLERRPDMRALAPVGPLSEYALPAQVIPSPLPAAGGHFWEQVILRGKVGSDDLLVNLCSTAPVGVKRQIVMMHDVNYQLGPKGYSRKFRYWYTALQGQLVKRATICTVSHWSAKEIAKTFDIPVDSITVIPNAAGHLDDVEADLATCARYGIDARPYVLCVGSANPNKNFDTALAAYAGLENPPFDLVIVGGTNPKIFQAEMSMVSNPNVHRLPRISDAELKAVFQGASAFVMPSFLEGFGIPAIEAMHLGVPVIAARASALPEVCADAALYFDPQDASELAQAMNALTSDASLHADLVARGYRNVARYDWDSSADQLDQLIERAYGKVQ